MLFTDSYCYLLRTLHRSVKASRLSHTQVLNSVYTSSFLVFCCLLRTLHSSVKASRLSHVHVFNSVDTCYLLLFLNLNVHLISLYLRLTLLFSFSPSALHFGSTRHSTPSILSPLNPPPYGTSLLLLVTFYLSLISFLDHCIPIQIFFYGHRSS